MKRIILLLFAISLISCGSSKTVRNSKKVIKGNWTLNSLDYSKTGSYNIKLLDDAAKKCFENTNWQFVPNNNTGTYTLIDDACNVGERHFVFVIDEVDESTGLYDFLLKPTNKKGKSETNKGFRFKLKSLSETNMQWQQTVSPNGVPFIINMNFIKE